MRERAITYFELRYGIWVRYRTSLSRMILSVHGLLGGRFVPSYEIVNSVLMSGMDRHGVNFVKWKPFSISIGDYNYAAKVLRTRFNVRTAKSIPGIHTLRTWSAYRYHLYHGGFPMDDYIRIRNGIDSCESELDELEEEGAVSADVSRRIEELYCQRKAISAEWEELDKIYPLLSIEARDAIDREILIRFDVVSQDTSDQEDRLLLSLEEVMEA